MFNIRMLMKMKYIISLFLFASITRIGNAQDNESAHRETDRVKRMTNIKMKDTSIIDSSDIAVNEKEAISIINDESPFGIYKDTYLITGMPLNKAINSNTADAVFQISIRHRLTKNILPFSTFLFLIYTQKSFWDIYRESAPFQDTNYNPGIGVGKYFGTKSRLTGGMLISIEHESNGRDKDDSRSWNYLSFKGKHFINRQLSVGLNLWIPYVSGSQNKDLIDYRGLGTFSLNAISYNKRWWISGDFTPRNGWGNINSIIGVAYKTSEKSNQYLFLCIKDGKGESLLQYSKYKINLRFGICIKPDFHSFL